MSTAQSPAPAEILAEEAVANQLETPPKAPEEAAIAAAQAQQLAAQAMTGTAPKIMLPITADELLQAEKHLSDYLGAQLASDDSTKAFLDALMLSVKPDYANKHTALHLHFNGRNVPSDPGAFIEKVETVLRQHPMLHALLSQPGHAPQGHTGQCCAADIKVPGLSEQQYQSLVRELGQTPGGAIAPVAELGSIAPHEMSQHSAHSTPQADSPVSITEPPIKEPEIKEPVIKAPEINEPKIGPNTAAVPAATIASDNATIANDNEARPPLAEHQGTLDAAPAVAAARA